MTPLTNVGAENREATKMKRSFLSILAVQAVVQVGRADDFKTTNGEEYKNAKISRVEPDGIVLKTKSGVTKVYFSELPKEVQERFHYDPAQSAQFKAAQQETVTQQNAAKQQEQQERQQQEQQRRAEAIKKNVRRVQEVEIDQPSFLDQPLLLEGTTGIDNFYSDGYDGAEQTHYCFQITDSTGNRCHAYMERENAGNLPQQLVSAGSPLKGVFTVVLLSRRYYASGRHPGLFLELLDYRLE
jgi:hypothetical protein